MRPGPLFACVALAVACPRPARAYAWMVRHGYTTCATCHVDPSGSGVLTPYGRAQGEILLQSRYSGKPGEEASPAANFLWNALRTPDWLLGGGEVRYLALRMKLGDGPTAGDLILMQGDLAAAVHAGGFRASGSLGYISTTGSPAAVGGQVVSREHWAGWAFDEGELLVRAGRMNVPFGIRSIEHTLFVRQATRSDLNDTQQHGVAVSYSAELIRGELMAIAGNFQIRNDANRQRGYSGYVELAPVTRFAIGVSSLVTHAAEDVRLRVANTRQAHGAFVRASPWRPLVLLGEADYVIQSPSGAPSQKGLATMLQADYEPWQGLHLIATGETLDVAGAGISYGGWLSAAWFFAPHLDIRADFMNRSEVIGATRYAVLAYMAQGHLYF